MHSKAVNNNNEVDDGHKHKISFYDPSLTPKRAGGGGGGGGGRC